jgi:3-phosphoinositide dependent protein kinase-1
VGTEDYIAPEIINNEEPSFASDLWSLGIILFQLLVGKTPFKGQSPFYTFENILAGKYSMPDTVPEDAKDLITRLLKVDPSQRLGSGNFDKNSLSPINDMEALKAHSFFEGINVSTLQA